MKGYQRWAGAMSSMADHASATATAALQKLVLRRGAVGDTPYVDTPRLIHGVLGLAGESGELAQHVLKAIFHGRDLSHVALTKEIGDCFWYLNEIATALELNFDDVVAVNVEKLTARYNSGEFTTAEEQAADRSSAAEVQPTDGWAQQIEKAARDGMSIDEWLEYAKGVIPESLLPSVGPHLTEFYVDWMMGNDP